MILKDIEVKFKCECGKADPIIYRNFNARCNPNSIKYIIKVKCKNCKRRLKIEKVMAAIAKRR